MLFVYETGSNLSTNMESGTCAVIYVSVRLRLNSLTLPDCVAKKSINMFKSNLSGSILYCLHLNLG